jgi:hypothetical protein
MKNNVSFALIGLIVICFTTAYCIGCSLFHQDSDPEKFIGTWLDPDEQVTFTIAKRENIMLMKLGETTLSGKISGNCIEAKNLSGEKVEACLEGDSTLVLRGKGKSDIALQKVK